MRGPDDPAARHGAGLDGGTCILGIPPAYLFVALFLVMLTVGLALGGFGPVYANARVICNDCIGIF